jgi:hypothetical protein
MYAANFYRIEVNREQPDKKLENSSLCGTIHEVPLSSYADKDITDDNPVNIKNFV